MIHQVDDGHEVVQPAAVACGVDRYDDALGKSVCNAVQPASKGLELANGGCTAQQDEECRLKYVFGFGVVVQDAPAHAENHGSVAAQQGRESNVVACLDESSQEEVVARVSMIAAARQAAEVLQQHWRG